MFRRVFKPGDLVVFRKTKHSPRPGPRARDVNPTPHGDDYVYHVDKFWIVAATYGDQILVRTRGGKEHLLDSDEVNLRHANLWERLFHGARFPQLTSTARAG